ncbi:MAG TPA: flagellar biosynthetic protein FliR [Spirochaetota bacterium]|nr:flagellar biosynthetic protein FliR [Spirochaetota bacterium]HOS34091.1 flagellar biosynthetic protein FliR [Spirochaetota bacterium]HOS56551.1 flagellar biosynthetic protein FliR [Spirochaetota bacterium]HPK62622.1 flagellar biosynthetic protein FliR [Spirochaetota bacterium]HQF78856.1 flagellar biosynthetic protein FliR [Spirochaetota bacterium]
MLVFARIMGLMLTSTFYESDSIINQVKLGLTFFVTAVMFPVVFDNIPEVPQDIVQYGLIAIGEGLIGATIGICITISFSVYQLAGQYFTVQMGLGASEVFDPMSQISLPLMGQYLYLVAIMVFLAIKGPLIIIYELYYSYGLVTIESLTNGVIINSPYGIVGIFSSMFLVALRISLPIVASLLLVSISMGLLAKAAPQMNLLMIGFPISIGVSFAIIIFLLPLFVEFVDNYMNETFNSLYLLMKEMKVGT